MNSAGGSDARCYASWLEEVAAPPLFRVIGERTFADCKNLKSVTFGDSQMLEEIEPDAFFECGLESFPFLPSLRKVEDMAFGRCCALREF